MRFLRLIWNVPSHCQLLAVGASYERSPKIGRLSTPRRHVRPETFRSWIISKTFAVDGEVIAADVRPILIGGGN